MKDLSAQFLVNFTKKMPNPQLIVSDQFTFVPWKVVLEKPTHYVGN